MYKAAIYCVSEDDLPVGDMTGDWPRFPVVLVEQDGSVQVVPGTVRLGIEDLEDFAACLSQAQADWMAGEDDE